MALEALYITDEMGDVVDRINTALTLTINYEFGEEDHIIKALRDMGNAGLTKYPLIALVLPVDIKRGSAAGGYYGIASIQRLIIATVTNPTHSPKQRQEEIIKPIIQPIYDEFLKQLTKQKTFAVMGEQVEHRQQIRFGTQSAAQGFTEYIDGMEILDMKLVIKQNCI